MLKRTDPTPERRDGRRRHRNRRTCADAHTRSQRVGSDGQGRQLRQGDGPPLGRQVTAATSARKTPSTRAGEARRSHSRLSRALIRPPPMMASWPARHDIRVAGDRGRGRSAHDPLASQRPDHRMSVAHRCQSGSSATRGSSGPPWMDCASGWMARPRRRTRSGASGRCWRRPDLAHA